MSIFVILAILLLIGGAIIYFFTKKKAQPIIRQIVSCPIGYEIINNTCVFKSCPPEYSQYNPPQGGQIECVKSYTLSVVDCKTVEYGPLVTIKDNDNKRRLVRVGTVYNNCEQIILKETGNAITNYNEESKTYTTEITMTTDNLDKLKNLNNNFRSDEIDYIRTFILNTLGIPNAIINSIDLYYNNEKITIGTSLVQPTNLSFNTIVTKFSNFIFSIPTINKAIIVNIIKN